MCTSFSIVLVLRINDYVHRAFSFFLFSRLLRRRTRKPITLVKSWRKLLDHKASNHWEAIEEGDNEDGIVKDVDMIPLIQKLPGCENADIRDVQKWMAGDTDFEYTENDIVQLVRKGNEEQDSSEEDERRPAHQYSPFLSDSFSR